MKLLIAASDAAPEGELPPGIELLVESASDVLVISPSDVSRLKWATGDIDSARRIADRRLERVLGHLEDRDVDAQGVIGDELPLYAFSDAVRDFDPDHILIGARGEVWQEEGLVERLLERFGLPVTTFLVGT